MTSRMRYASIDIETTGIDPSRHQILEIGCVVEAADWSTPIKELPTFRALVNPGEIRGEARALKMNADLITELVAGGDRCLDIHQAVVSLSDFLRSVFGADATITIAGKNFGSFDFQFLRAVAGWSRVHHKHRFIDVGTLWWNPLKDTHLPSLPECVRRARIPERAAHKAVDDCLTVIELVRARLLPISEGGRGNDLAMA